MNSYQRRFGPNITEHEGHGRFGSAGFRITIRAFEAQDAEVTELSRKISFSALNRQGTHISDYIGRRFDAALDAYSRPKFLLGLGQWTRS